MAWTRARPGHPATMTTTMDWMQGYAAKGLESCARAPRSQASASPKSTMQPGGQPNAFAELGAKVEEVTVREHADAIHLWNVIATDGGTWQMLRGNGYGYKGRYSPELMDYYARVLGKNFDAAAPTVKSVTHYAKAQNLARRFRTAYDAELRDVDVLVMPTQPMLATVIPDADAGSMSM